MEALLHLRIKYKWAEIEKEKNIRPLKLPKRGCKIGYSQKLRRN
jgi:hypothetical protein